jgi:hypothetical protein
MSDTGPWCCFIPWKDCIWLRTHWPM